MSLEDTGEKLEDWRRRYSEDRPHRAIGYTIPSALYCLDEPSRPPS
ncbi:integrase core domain-containing protein [Thioclava sp. 'Guangxiensis']